MKAPEVYYRWAYRVIDTRSFGLPQRRLRVFVLAGIDGDPRDVLLCKSTFPLEEQWTLGEVAHGFYWTEGNRGLGWARNAIPALKGGSGCFIPSPPAIVLRNDEIVTPTIEACERLQGFPKGWTKPAIRLGYQRRRWAYVGNAVAVNVAEWIGRRLGDPGRYDPANDQPLEASSPWPNAAWFDGKNRCQSKVSIWPVARKMQDLETYIGEHHQPLSGRATAGFLVRLEASSLRTTQEFKRILRRHINRMGAMELYLSLKRARQQQTVAF
jgi:DNA (cytosine-5)-methyltransferase 1